MSTRLDTALSVAIVVVILLAVAGIFAAGRELAPDIAPVELDRTPAACRCGERGQA